MTYQEQIERLQNESIQKSHAHQRAMNERRKKAKPGDIAAREQTYKEWEAAEHAYTNLLIAIKMKQVKPGDNIRG